MDETGSGEVQDEGGGAIPHRHDGLKLPEGLVATPDSSPDGRHYVYREGEFLVVTEDLPLIQDRLAANGWREATKDDATGREEPLRRLGITRCLVKTNDKLPDAVALLRKPVEKRFPDGELRQVVPRVYPDIAVPLQYHASWHPAGPRVPAPKLGDLPRRRLLPLAGHRVTVGVLDTGMPDAPMGWFQRRCDALRDHRDPLGSPVLTHTDGHGRFIAGIVLRYAPGVRVKVRRLKDHFDDWVTDSELAPAIVALANEGVDIINLSVSASTHDDTGLGATQAAVEGLRVSHPHLVLVVAAGNAGVNVKHYPGSLTNVISVGAVNEHDNSRPDFSNWGEWVNASAPGVNVHSIFVEGQASPPAGQSQNQVFDGYAKWTGTSFSAPIMAAAIATTRSPGGWRQYLWFLRPKTAFEAAFRLFSDSRLPRVPGSGTIVRPKPYVS